MDRLTADVNIPLDKNISMQNQSLPKEKFVSGYGFSKSFFLCTFLEL
jgi:hypothetical protein